MIFQVPSGLPFASFVNPKIGFSQRENIVYQYNQIVQSYASDTQAGGITPGTTIPWNKTSETASLIWEYYYTHAASVNLNDPTASLPADLEKIMEDNAGPNERWNYSYEQWGVVPGVTGSLVEVNTVEVGSGRGVRVIVP